MRIFKISTVILFTFNSKSLPCAEIKLLWFTANYFFILLAHRPNTVCLMYLILPQSILFFVKKKEIHMQSRKMNRLRQKTFTLFHLFSHKSNLVTTENGTESL